MRLLSICIAATLTALLTGCAATETKPPAPAVAETREKAPARESVFKSEKEFDPDDVAAIYKMRDDWAAAFNAGQGGPVDFIFENDAVFAFPEGPENSAKSLFDRYAAKLMFEGESRFVSDGGDPRKTKKLPWVSYYSNYVLTLTPKHGGGAVEKRGQFMTRFRRQSDGSLKVMRSPRLGESAPDFALKTMKSGENVQLSSLYGRPIVLIFGSYT